MRKWGIWALVLCLMTGCGPAESPVKKAGSTVHPALLEAAPLAELAGEATSPDGRFRAETAGETDLYISGVRVPEHLRIVDTETGETLWEDRGYVTQSVLWSPEGSRVALTYGGRTWETVRVLDTQTWTAWDFTLPDGSPIPEYTFLPEDWGQWTDEDTLTVTVGQGGDSGTQRTCHCHLSMEDGALTAMVLEETREALPGSYDFDHDGTPETVELASVRDGSGTQPAWYQLEVIRADGTALWRQDLAEAHVGWGSVFACTVDGKDCLLRYDPTMFQGLATYSYAIFSLAETGEEQIFQTNSVSFDINFGSDLHQEFDPATIAAFLEEVHGLLAESTLLASTEGGALRTGGSGAEFREDWDFWDEICPYDESKSLEENLRTYRDVMEGLAGTT